MAKEKRSELQLGLASFQASARQPLGEGATAASLIVGQFQALRQLKHPNLCAYFDLLVGRGQIVVIASEHFSVSLADELASRPQGLGYGETFEVASQVSKGLCYLNVAALVHGHLELETVLRSETGGLKLTGHALGFLTRHGILADFRVRPSVGFLAPELTSASVCSQSVVSCKADVWSLGILLLHVCRGHWQPRKADEQSPPNLNDDADETLVRLETARALRRLSLSPRPRGGVAGVDDGELGATPLTVPCVLDGGMENVGGSSGVPLPSAFPLDGLKLQRLESSYRRWLVDFCECEGPREQELMYDFWASCLTLTPGARPSPSDLVGHPALAARDERNLECEGPYGSPSQDGTNGESKEFKWSVSPALQSDHLLLPSLGEPNSDARLCGGYFRSLGVRMDELFYWWCLAGGDPFRELVARHVLRPSPPIFRLPLCSRDAAGESEKVAPSKCTSPSKGTSGVATNSEGARAVFPREQPSQTDRSSSGQIYAFWGPPASLRPRGIGVSFLGLCQAMEAAECLGTSASNTLMPGSPYARQRHFAYQWLRTRRFQTLLLTLPSSRKELFGEAAVDVPPLLRPKAWVALLGGNSIETELCCWAPFYEQLVASPVDFTGEEIRVAMQCPLSHELLSHPRGRQRLEQLVRAALKANPSLTRMDGLGAIIAPLAALYPEREPVAFLCLQRILHGCLWHFYAEESPMKRRLCVNLFGALLRFADPELELHLHSIGLPPDAYASSWFPTWFAQLLQLPQLLLLWDALMLRPPQFSLFVGVCLMHLFRQTFLAVDDVSHALSFIASCAQLVDIPHLVRASLTLFEDIPVSVTLPLYPRHSAGDAMLSPSGITPVDHAWIEETRQRPKGAMQELQEEQDAVVREMLTQRAMDQWRQCEWWRRRVALAPTPPIITVDDLLSYRNRCFVVDARSAEAFAERHFQGSTHIPDPEEGDLRSMLPNDLLAACSTPGVETGNAAVCREGCTEDASPPWLFGSEALEENLEVKLVVVIGSEEDYGGAFATRLFSAGVRHVTCLLGGAAALAADAPSYLVTSAGRVH